MNSNQDLLTALHAVSILWTDLAHRLEAFGRQNEHARIELACQAMRHSLRATCSAETLTADERRAKAARAARARWLRGY